MSWIPLAAMRRSTRRTTEGRLYCEKSRPVAERSTASTRASPAATAREAAGRRGRAPSVCRAAASRAGSFSAGATWLSATAPIAAEGMPSNLAVAGSWTMQRPPASWMARRPSAPSDPVPERTTPTASDPCSSASDRKKPSTAIRWPRGALGTVSSSAPSNTSISRLGGMTWTVSARTFIPSVTSTTGIRETRWRSSTRTLACSGSRCWTTTKAAPRPGGTFWKNCSSAASPPADAPRPTMTTPVRRPSRGGDDRLPCFCPFGRDFLAGINPSSRPRVDLARRGWSAFVSLARGAPPSLLEHGLELLDRRRLGQVGVEPGVRGAPPIVRQAVAAQRDEVRAAGPGLAAQRLRDRVAVHLREPDVAQHDVGRELPGALQPVGPGVRHGHLVPLDLQREAEALRGVDVVLDDEDAARVRGGCRRGGRDRARGRRQRQPHDQLRAGAPARARGFDRASVCLDEPLDERQPEPEPPHPAIERAVGLAELLEEAGQHLRVDADARVPHAEHRVAPDDVEGQDDGPP